MRYMKKNGEVTMEEAIDLIVAYFEGDFDLITLFTEVASEMVEATEGARIRYNERIIGVAVPDERYRFYILKQDGAYTVKYKHHSEALPFVQQDKERYYTCNMECRAFFDAHPEMRVYASAPTDEIELFSFLTILKKYVIIYI